MAIQVLTNFMMLLEIQISKEGGRGNWVTMWTIMLPSAMNGMRNKQVNFMLLLSELIAQVIVHVSTGRLFLIGDSDFHPLAQI